MEKELISVSEYAKRRGLGRHTIYQKIKTPETPNGIIIPEIVKGVWKIDWDQYKDLELPPSPKRRTKVPLSKGRASKF